MKRKETQLLMEEWRKVLNEGLYDEDPELLEEGWKEKLQAGLAGLMFLTSLGGMGGNDASAYPNNPMHQKSLQKVKDNLENRFQKKADEIEKKYPGSAEKIAADKNLYVLYKLYDKATKEMNFEEGGKLQELFKELKPLIEKKGDYYFLPQKIYDKFAGNPKYKDLFNKAADIAGKVNMNEPVQTKGAKSIYHTYLEGVGLDN